MNEDALLEIFELYAPVLYKYVFRLCRDAVVADHIVGDVFTKLLGHLSAGKGPSTNLRSYLYEMAHHLVVDEMRSFQRSVPMEALYFRHQDAYSTDTSVETRVLFEAVLRAIKNDLTANQRHVVILLGTLLTLRYANQFDAIYFSFQDCTKHFIATSYETPKIAQSDGFLV